MTVFAPRLFPDTAYYAAMASHRHVAVSCAESYNKRCKAVHRFTIADTRGPLQLTVPVARPKSSHGVTWADITVSPHGEWWQTMPVALESAYGRTPYFEFYIDRFLPVISERQVGRPITDMIAAADKQVRDILELPVEVDYCYNPMPAEACSANVPDFDMPPYWQVRAASLGFIPGLSVLDLIFNLGPEAVLYIDRIINRR